MNRFSFKGETGTPIIKYCSKCGEETKGEDVCYACRVQAKRAENFFKEKPKKLCERCRKNPLQEGQPRYCSKKCAEKICVFFVKSLDKIKIGCSKDVERRMETVEGKLIAYFPGSRKIQSSIHRKFELDRISGEWFRAEKILEWIKREKASIPGLVLTEDAGQ